VVKDVRGLGLMWAIEFGEPDKGRTTWRMLEKMQPGIFAQLVVVPLFTDHRILSQVAGHRVNVVKGLPPLTITEEDVEWFAEALDAVVAEAQKLRRSMTSFALRAARAGRKKPTGVKAGA
jgi:4-aminobutyrate aminotransferase-like enzyme